MPRWKALIRAIVLGSLAGLIDVNAGVGVESFSADDTTVSAGAQVTLSWELQPGQTSATISPGVGDVLGRTTDGLGSVVLSPGPSASTAFTLSTDGASGPDSASLIVTVGELPEILGFAAAIDGARPESRRNLSWDVVGASSLHISPDIGPVPASGLGYYAIVPTGSVWQYLDDGSDQGTSWRSFDFDETNWAEGPGELGYGERDEATVVGFGGPPASKAIATYFRHTFFRTAVDAIAELRLGIRYDDGAVVYLNGVEIGRYYMPAGVVDFSTPALGDVPGDSDDYQFYSIPPAMLREGRNVLAVEIHQSRPGSSDMSFDLTLEGVMAGELPVVPSGNTTYTLAATNDFGTVTAEIDVVVSIRPVTVFGFDAALPEDLLGAAAAVLEGATPPALVPGGGRHGAGAFEFDGGGSLRISGAVPDGDAMSLAFWINAAASIQADSIALDAGIEFSKIETPDSDGLCVELPGGDEFVVDDVFDGTWHHIALMVETGSIENPGKLRIYRDGVLQVVSAHTSGDLSLPAEWVVGGADDGSDRLVGLIEDLAVFDRVISADEVTQLVQDGAVSFLVPRILMFAADDLKVAPLADVTLSWIAVDADRVDLTPIVGAVDSIGEATVQLPATTDFVLTATNAFGRSSHDLAVTTGPLPVIRRFSMSPDVIPADGGTTTLSWQVSDSTSVMIDRGIGSVGELGSVALNPTSLSTYRLAAENDFGISHAVATATVVDEPGGGSWTLAIIPDTQHYADNAANAPIFTEITSWIVAHRDNNNIRFVLQEGDVVENNTTIEWDRARASFGVLDGQVPYAVTTGNHDLGPGGNASTRTGEFNLATRFGAGSPYAAQPTLGGYYEGTGDPSYRESSYHTFHANGHDYLILALEWEPRDEVVEWANTVVAAHPSHRAILVTHMYLTSGNSRWTGAVGLGENNGENLWQKLVRPHENFIMTANGHDLSLGYLESFGDRGNTVHQMLYNAQGDLNGGDGWIRLLEFQPDGATVEVKTFSPHREALGLSAWRTDPANQFTLQLSPFPQQDSDGDHIPDGWESAYGLDPEDASDAAADPNGNGLNNFLEYALAGRPHAPNSISQSEPLVVENVEGVRNRLTFRRRIAGATSLDYIVERSFDLKHWISDPGDGSEFAEMSVKLTGDATQTVVVEDLVTPVGSSKQVFYRLRIVREDP